MTLEPGDIWRYHDPDGSAYNYLVLRYETDTIVLIRELETGIMEAWPVEYRAYLQKGIWERLT